MCTYTLVKLDDGNHCISQNRDEKREKPLATPPRPYMINDLKWICPIDAEHAGTWMTVCQDQPRTYNLMNGAEAAHLPEPPYKHSRGLVIMELMESENAQSYFAEKDLDRIEPFTLMAQEGKELTKYSWDGAKLKSEKIKDENVIRSSSTLYDDKVKAEREKLFQDSLDDLKTWQDVIDFHHRRGEENEAIAISRHEVYSQNTYTVLLDENFNYLEHKFLELDY